MHDRKINFVGVLVSVIVVGVCSVLGVLWQFKNDVNYNIVIILMLGLVHCLAVGFLLNVYSAVNSRIRKMFIVLFVTTLARLGVVILCTYVNIIVLVVPCFVLTITSIIMILNSKDKNAKLNIGFKEQSKVNQKDKNGTTFMLVIIFICVMICVLFFYVDSGFIIITTLLKAIAIASSIIAVYVYSKLEGINIIKYVSFYLFFGYMTLLYVLSSFVLNEYAVFVSWFVTVSVIAYADYIKQFSRSQLSLTKKVK